MARIVLLPGMDGTAQLFRPFVASCPPQHQVQTFEYQQVEAESYDSLCEQVAAALPSEDFFLLGWSFSGPLTLKLAARGLERLRGVILVASFVQRPIRYLPPWLSVFARPTLFRVYPMLSMGQALVQGYSTPALRALQSETFAAVSPRSVASRVRLLLEVDARRELQDCPVPVLYVRAENDRVIHRRHGELIAQAPRASLVEVPGPHLCLATHPSEAWRAVEPFLRDNSKRA